MFVHMLMVGTLFYEMQTESLSSNESLTHASVWGKFPDKLEVYARVSPAMAEQHTRLSELHPERVATTLVPPSSVPSHMLNHLPMPPGSVFEAPALTDDAVAYAF